MPTDYTRYIPEYQSGGITPVSSFDDLPEALKAYYTANPIDWTATGTPATKTNVADLLAPETATPANDLNQSATSGFSQWVNSGNSSPIKLVEETTPAPTSEPTTPAYTSPTSYQTTGEAAGAAPVADTGTAQAVADAVSGSPSAAAITTDTSPAASTYQASTAYSTGNKKKSKLPFDSVLFQGQTSEIL